MIEMYVSRKLYNDMRSKGIQYLHEVQADMAMHGLKEVTIRLFDTNKDDNVLWIKENHDGISDTKRIEGDTDLVSRAGLEVFKK